MADAMTEVEWDAAEHTYDMIYHRRCRDDRKRRLLASACVRRFLGADVDSRLIQAVEFAEAWADGSFDRDQWLATRRGLRTFQKQKSDELTIEAVQISRKIRACLCLLQREFMSYKTAIEDSGYGQRDTETPEQCRLAREIFFNPFRQLVFDESWMSWNDGLIKRMAHTIYDEQRYDELSVLGDALEEAGCEESLILNHCRQVDEHIRGCWLIDFLTGRDDLLRDRV